MYTILWTASSAMRDTYYMKAILLFGMNGKFSVYRIRFVNKVSI